MYMHMYIYKHTDTGIRMIRMKHLSLYTYIYIHVYHISVEVHNYPTSNALLQGSAACAATLLRARSTYLCCVYIYIHIYT